MPCQVLLIQKRVINGFQKEDNSRPPAPDLANPPSAIFKCMGLEGLHGQTCRVNQPKLLAFLPPVQIGRQLRLFCLAEQVVVVLF